MCSFDDKKGIFNSCWQISSVRLKISAEKSREKEIEGGEGERERERGREWMEKVPGLEADVLDGPRRISGEVYLKRTRFTLGLQKTLTKRK